MITQNKFRDQPYKRDDILRLSHYARLGVPDCCLKQIFQIVPLEDTKTGKSHIETKREFVNLETPAVATHSLSRSLH